MRYYVDILQEAYSFTGNDMGNDMGNEVKISNDPIRDMSAEIADKISGNTQEIYVAIETFLKNNKYEISPIGDLTDEDGNI
jgi:hypothetical protein